MKRKCTIVSVIIIALLLSGCTSVREVYIEDRVQPANGMANVVIYTRHPFLQHKVNVGNAIVGDLAICTPLFLQIEPGVHKMHTVTPGWVIDHPIDFDFKANLTYYFKVDLDNSGWGGHVRLLQTEKISSYPGRCK